MSETPFKGKLIESAVDKTNLTLGKLKELEGNRSKIIRVITYEKLKSRYDSKIEPFEVATAAKRLFGELQEKYNIPVSVNFVIGKDENGEKVVYTLTDRIEGEPMHKIDFTIPENKELLSKVEELFVSLTKYFKDKINNGGYYLIDIFKPEQYVIGFRDEDKNRKIHLVDTDLYIGNEKYAIYKIVGDMLRYISIVEENIGVRFEMVREEMRKFISESPESVSGNDNSEKTVRIHKQIIFDLLAR